MPRRIAPRIARRRLPGATARSGTTAALVAPTLALALALAMALAACSDDSGSAGGTNGADVDGARLFGDYCAACHGPALEGTANGPSLLEEAYAPRNTSDDDIRRAVGTGVDGTRGFGSMPAIRSLDADQVAAVIDHIRAAQDAAAPGSGRP